MVFLNDYADLYDLFYGNKDYRAECDYVLGTAKKYSDRSITSILDIGCGTGGHALLWAQDGIDVTGLDRSPTMLSHARVKAEKMKLSTSFLEGDIRGFDLGRRFDAATSMFAVMSYQTRTADVLSALSSVRRHLAPAGLFLFDVWSGPGVISDPPTERVKSFLKGELEILRTVRPVHDVSRNMVEVQYDILCIQKDRIVKRIREAHQMRYFFPQEMEEFASRSGFELLACEPFMKQADELHVHDWNAMFVLKAK